MCRMAADPAVQQEEAGSVTAYRPIGAVNIFKTASRMVEMAEGGGGVVSAVFNGIKLSAGLGSKPSDIVGEYMRRGGTHVIQV